MCLSLGLLAASKASGRNDDPYPPQRPRPMQQSMYPRGPNGKPPSYSNGPAESQTYDPWQGPPGYVSAEAGRWRGPLGRRLYENDVYQYGIVEADVRAKRRRRRGAAAAAASAGAGAGC